MSEQKEIAAYTEKEIAALEAKIKARDEEQAKDADMLRKLREHKKLADIRKVNELISKLGLTVDDVASISFVQLAIKQTLKAPVKGAAKAPSTGGKGNSSEYVAPEPKWAKEGFKPYGGGRGKKPQWVKDAEANGTLDNYLIKKPA
jgi:DNA-binding protein H-NS